MLVDGEHLYLGFTCSDPAPEKISLHTMQRDGDMLGDDTVAVVVDPYGDRRTGYAFRINSAGARVDGLISTPERLSLDWDGIWDARTRRTDTGWTAEIVIPFRTLSFTPGLKSWGFNIERVVARERLLLRWASPTLNSFFYDMSRAGELEGVEDLKKGLGLEISPYILGRRTHYFAAGGSALRGDPGVDITYRLTSQLTAVFTGNTDFAETEVDTRRVNLTRFPLFFPEKRSFFLEGANQFNFGLGLEPGLEASFLPFFSRRVGLFSNQQVPLEGGVKLWGRAGRWGLALLDVETGATWVSDANTRAITPVPKTNLFAGRITYDMDKHLRLGSILTNGNPDGIHRNSLFGFDAVWRTSTFRGNKNLLLGGWAVRSQNDTTTGQRHGWGFLADYPNDLWDISLSAREFGDGMDPALGFLPRPGTRQYRFGSAFQPRPSPDSTFSWIRQFFFEFFYTRVDDLQNNTQSWRVFFAPWNVRTQSGEHLEFNYTPQFEFLPAPFELAPGVVIPPGRYPFTRFRAEAQSSDHRPLRVGSTTWFGEFYNGTLTQWEHYVRWTSGEGHLQLELSTENDFARLPVGNFVQRLWQLKFVYSLTPNLVFSSYNQYDTESENFGTNTRLRWTFRPGNDLFLVWNRGWKRPLGTRDLDLLPETEFVGVKLRWTFRR